MGPSRVRHSQSGSAVQLARNTKTKLATGRNRLQPGGAGGGGTDVVERECEEQFLGVVRPARGGLPQVGVVAVGMGDRRTEDRWVGCRAGHAAVADQFDEAAVVEESRESVSSQMDTRAWRSRRRLTRGAMVVSSAYLLAAGSPARGPSGVPGSASAAAGTGWRERISAWMCSCTSQTLTFMPATTRPSCSQNAMNSPPAGSPRNTTSSQCGAYPEYSIPASYWSEKKYGMRS